MTPSAPRMGACLEYAQRVLGGPLVENDSNPSIPNATVTVVVDGNGDRVALVIINTGTNDAYVSIDPNITAPNGIKIANSGGSFTIDVTEDFTLPSRRWYGWCPTGTTQFFVLEMIRFALAPPTK